MTAELKFPDSLLKVKFPPILTFFIKMTDPDEFTVNPKGLTSPME